MTEFSVRKGHLYRGEKVLECPYSPRGGVCGDWCPLLSIQEHPMVIGTSKTEVVLHCAPQRRAIVLEGGVTE